MAHMEYNASDDDMRWSVPSQLSVAVLKSSSAIFSRTTKGTVGLSAGG